MVLQRLFRRNDNEEIAASIYAEIVAHARRPELFSTLKVPDTLDGRFDILVLHAFLFFRRLKSEDEANRALGQAVFDAMFKDLDQVVRELGVSDIAVAKRIRKMASAFYGRVGAYDEALDAYESDPELLLSALRRNIYPEQETEQGVVEALAGYVANCEKLLATQEFDAFLAGKLRFADVPVGTSRQTEAQSNG